MYALLHVVAERVCNLWRDDQPAGTGVDECSDLDAFCRKRFASFNSAYTSPICVPCLVVAGGGRSFKDAMHHLENAARKVANAHLHTPIRKSETLPNAQQVNCSQQLDVLLAEIMRIAP
jgi:hypothetical protein